MKNLSIFTLMLCFFCSNLLWAETHANYAEGTNSTQDLLGKNVTGQLSINDPPTFKIGDQLIIIVDDADMNLDPNAVDVWDWNQPFDGHSNCVKIDRNGSRDGVDLEKHFFVPLYETGANTGIFTGVVNFCCGETYQIVEDGEFFFWIGFGTEKETCLEGARNVTYMVTYYDAADFYGNEVTKSAAAAFQTTDGAIELEPSVVEPNQMVLVTVTDADLNISNEIEVTYDPGPAEDQNWTNPDKHRPLSAPNNPLCDGDCGFVMVVATTCDGYHEDCDSIYLYLQETCSEPGIFTGRFTASGIPGSTHDAPNGDENTDILYVDGLDSGVENPEHESIYVLYVDSPTSGNNLKIRTDTAAATLSCEMEITPNNITLSYPGGGLCPPIIVQLNETHSGCAGDILWSSSDTNVVTVDRVGLITAQNPGQAIIRATCSTDPRCFDECMVNVISCPSEENQPPYPPTLLSPENGSILTDNLVIFSWINNGDPEQDAVGSWLYILGPWGQEISMDMGSFGFVVGEEISFSLDLFSAQEWAWSVYIYDPNHNSYPYYNYQIPFWHFTISGD